MTEVIELVSIVVMASPTVGEILNDAHGDAHDKTNKDIYWRVGTTLLAAGVVRLINHDHTFIQNLCMSTAIFCAFFSYIVNYAMLKNKVINAVWWDHLNNKSYPDKSKVWKAIPWQWRAVIYASILVIGTVIYIL